MRVSSALFGLAVAIALYPHFAAAPAPHHQLPGFPTLHGFNGHAPFRFFACVVLLTVAMPLLLRPLYPRLRPSIASAAWLGSLWFATIEQKPWWVLSIGLAGTIAAFVLRDPKSLRFRRADAILLPTFAMVFMALLDIKPSLTLPKLAALSAAIVFTTRVLAGSSEAFAAAPLGMIVQSHLSPWRHLGWIPLTIAVVTPLVLRFLLRPQWRRRVQWSIAWIVYPIVTLAFVSAANPYAVDRKPHGDLFEDSHRLVPASEMLRGEKPYRDIVPSHGLIEDGLLDYITMRTGEVTAGRVATVHGYVSTLNVLGSYALATAATGSASIGILAYFLAVTLGLAGAMTRMLPAIMALVFMVAAARSARPRWLIAAGALVVLAGLMSLDFGVYSLFGLLVTVFLFPTSKREAAIAAAEGLAAAGAVSLLILASFGIAGDFFRTTFGEILPTSAIYTLGVSLPTQSFPDILASVADRPGFFALAWPVALLLFATVRHVPLRILAAFETVVGIAYVERHHPYHICVLAPLIAVATALLFRRSRALGLTALGFILVVGALAGELASLAMLRTARGPLDPTLVEVTTVPRARGTLYREFEARTIEEVDRYARERMGADDTFYDFADRGNLFFLLDRDVPVRFVEVPFYESVKAQKDVIAAIERNWHVRAAIVPATDATAIDGVPNRVRAPLIWAYLQKNYQPDVAVGEIVIWRRVRFGST